MTSAQSKDSLEQLSPWWARAVALTFVFGFSVLILLTFKAYQNAPPIPDRAVDASGQLGRFECVIHSASMDSDSLASGKRAGQKHTLARPRDPGAHREL